MQSVLSTVSLFKLYNCNSALISSEKFVIEASEILLVVSVYSFNPFFRSTLPFILHPYDSIIKHIFEIILAYCFLPVKMKNL